MQIHEYQAKTLLRAFGIPVPEGHTAHSTEEARSIAQQLGGEEWIIKAQVHGGGRTLVGGVRRARGRDKLMAIVDGLLDHKLPVRAGGLSEQPVNSLLIERPVDIEQELYLAITIDRDAEQILCIASDDGGVGFQALIVHEPSHLYRVSVDPTVGLLPYHCRQVAQRLGFTAAQYRPFTDFLTRLYQFFVHHDFTHLEINPLVRLSGERFMALDVRAHVDDNALFRHEDLAELRDITQEDAREVSAERHGISYVRLRGNIGCVVNGAGLAMATMDLIKLSGGEPANFMDVGGTVTVPRVEEALRVLFAEEQVKAILVNVFGGIVRCDIVAQGLIDAVQAMGVRVPIVARLAGTHATEGLSLIQASGLPITCVADLTQAADAVVRASKEAR